MDARLRGDEGAAKGSWQRKHRGNQAPGWQESCLPVESDTKNWYKSLMSRNTSISLGDHFADFIDTQVAGGRYASASDVVRAGLRLLEEHEAKLEALRAALIEGEESGASEPFDFEAFIARKRGAAE